MAWMAGTRQNKPGHDDGSVVDIGITSGQAKTRSPRSSMICLPLEIEKAIASSRLSWVSARTNRCSFTPSGPSFSIIPAV